MIWAFKLLRNVFWRTVTYVTLDGSRWKDRGRLYTWFVLYRRMRQLYCGLVPVRHLCVTLAFNFILQYEIAGSYPNSIVYDLVNFGLSRWQLRAATTHFPGEVSHQNIWKPPHEPSRRYEPGRSRAFQSYLIFRCNGLAHFVPSQTTSPETRIWWRGLRCELREIGVIEPIW